MSCVCWDLCHAGFGERGLGFGRGIPTLFPPTGAAPPSSGEFGRLKQEGRGQRFGCGGIERVRLHADLTILAKLACALARSSSALAV